MQQRFGRGRAVGQIELSLFEVPCALLKHKLWAAAHLLSGLPVGIACSDWAVTAVGWPRCWPSPALPRLRLPSSSSSEVPATCCRSSRPRLAHRVRSSSQPPSQPDLVLKLRQAISLANFSAASRASVAVSEVRLQTGQPVQAKAPHALPSCPSWRTQTSPATAIHLDQQQADMPRGLVTTACQRSSRAILLCPPG